MRVQRVKQVAVMAGMVAVMTVAATVPARAQTAVDAEVQAQMVRQQAQIQAEVQAHMASLQVQVPPLPPLDVELPSLPPLHVELPPLPPLHAKLEMMLAPMQAEMMARGAAMQAQMMARTAVMQAEIEGGGGGQVKDDLFAGTEKFAKGASDVTDVNLDPSMMGMVGGKHGDLAHKLNFMVVRSYEYPEKGMYNMADVDAYRQKLKNGNWNCFVHTYESKTGESTDICNRALPNNQGNEMVIMTVEPKELTFIHMSGNASLADLGKLGSMGGHMVPERPERPEQPEKPEAPEKPE